MPDLTTALPRGLDGVVAAQTRLSHVDGQAGELIIGGYALKELAGHVSFEEAAHLLWVGALPTADELAGLRRRLAALRPLPAETMRVVRAAATAPPIDALRMACATVSLDLPGGRRRGRHDADRALPDDRGRPCASRQSAPAPCRDAHGRPTSSIWCTT